MTLETAYSRFLPRVRSWARGAGVPECDVDDVAQDVFRTFRRKKPALQERAVRRWLRVVTRRTARRHLAKTYRHRDHSRYDEAEHASPTPSQEQAIGGREVESAILGLVGRLRTARREVFVRHVLAEEPMEQIAADQKIPLATAYTRLRLAREELQASIERMRARERRTTRGSTSFALLPFLWSGHRRPWTLSLVAAPVLGAAVALVAWLLDDTPALTPTTAEPPARDDVPMFAPSVSFLEAPHEQPASRPPRADASRANAEPAGRANAEPTGHDRVPRAFRLEVRQNPCFTGESLREALGVALRKDPSDPGAGPRLVVEVLTGARLSRGHWRVVDEHGEVTRERTVTTLRGCEELLGDVPCRSRSHTKQAPHPRLQR